jgi:hypothetical protein
MNFKGLVWSPALKILVAQINSSVMSNASTLHTDFLPLNLRIDYKNVQDMPLSVHLPVA